MMPNPRLHSKSAAALAGLFSVLTSLAACSGGPSSPPPPPPPAISFTPTITPAPAKSVTLVEAARSSSTITFNVEATQIDGVASVFFDLVYNPAVLQFTSGSVGPFLASTGATVSFLLPADLTAANASGRMPMGIAITPANRSVSGSGTLCTVVFTAAASGASNISFEASGAGTPFPVSTIPGVTFSGGTLTVTR